MFHVTTENAPAAQELRTRMRRFYDSVPNYDAFAETNDLGPFWRPILAEVRARAESRRCRVLEFGAGRSGFATKLGSLRPNVEYHVQDITGVNAEHLGAMADQVWIGELGQITGHFDVIFSTFVWEHLPNPRESLAKLLALLSPDGCLILASPRYDLPGYVPPSARRLEKRSQWLLSAWLTLRRARVALGAKPDFLVHSEPACLHGPWFRDADAIHWVSLFDLRHLERDYRIERLKLPTFGPKHWLWARFALLFVRITRATPAR
jgi:SAM-dependent methyltransferase